MNRGGTSGTSVTVVFPMLDDAAAPRRVAPDQEQVMKTTRRFTAFAPIRARIDRMVGASARRRLQPRL